MTYLVTGATGTIGRLVCEELLRMGRPVRALTRARADAVLPNAIEIVEGDLERPETLAGAFAGVSAVHLITHTGPAYAPLLSGEAIMAQIRAAGVGKVSVLWRGVYGSIEQAAQTSGLKWTRLEPVEYMSNARFWAGAIKEGRPLCEPHIDLPAAVVDPRDVAAVAARVLVEDTHHAKVYSLTGPQALSTRQRVRMLSEELGRAVELHELSRDEARARWRTAGFADEQIANLESFATSTAARTVTDHVEAVLGRRPHAFADWLAANIDLFRS